VNAGYEAVAARVAAVARFLVPTLTAVTALLLVGGIALFVGIGLLGDWSGVALVLGGALGGLAAGVAVMEGLFARDVAQVRELPSVRREDVDEAIRRLSTTIGAGERQVVERRGLRRLVGLGRGLRALKRDVDDLAEGGLAPAVALGRALVPTRVVAVSLAAVAGPFVCGFGLVVLVLGLVAA